MAVRTIIKDGQIACSKCGETKDIRHFNKTPQNSYRGICYNCCRTDKNPLIYSRTERHELMENLFEQGLRKCSYCEEIKNLNNFSQNIKLREGYNYTCKTCVKSKKLTVRYGITLNDYFEVLKQQENRCDICEKEFSIESVDLRPNLDHDHTTGKMRALLCCNCNIGLGNFQDNINLLDRAKAYLQRHSND